MMTCKICKLDKELDQFNEDRKGFKRKDCKACQGEYNRNYYLKNRKKLLAYQEDFRLNNNEQIMKARIKKRNNENK